jgi:prepilin-type N-terminal cleavage/methylation domain-containing protein
MSAVRAAARRSAPPSRRGFTLIELLVVMAIIVVLMMLLLPAVQRARESARRSQCLNNIRQICLAAQNYMSSHRCYPSGWIAATADPTTNTNTTTSALNQAPTALHYGTNSGDFKLKLTDKSLLQVTGLEWSISDMWGWHSLLLPQMDASTMNIDFRKPKGGQPNGPALTYTISSYICPSANQNGAQLAYTNYRGNMGTTYTNGAFYLNSAVSDQMIKDGTTSTVLFGETPFGFWGDALSCCARVPQPSELSNRTIFDWASPQNAAGCGNNTSGTGGTGTGGTGTGGTGGTTGTGGTGSTGGTSTTGCVDVLTLSSVTETYFLIFGFGSHHDDVVNFAMADGSARPVSKSISSLIMQALATRDGAERISDNF